MKTMTKKWLEFAKRDLKDAETLFKSKSWESSILHAHQAVEKTLKAILAERNLPIRKTHDLEGLAGDTKINFPSAVLGFIEELNPYYNPVRYPDSAIEFEIVYNKKETQKILKTTKEVIKWLGNHLTQ